MSSIVFVLFIALGMALASLAMALSGTTIVLAALLVAGVGFLTLLALTVPEHD